MGIGNPEAVSLQPIHKRWHNAGCDKFAYNFPVLHAPLLKFENRLSRDCAAFHSCDFGKFDDFSATITQPGELDNDIDCRGRLLPQSSLREVDASHQHHSLKT